jgi:hypothetical protein
VVGDRKAAEHRIAKLMPPQLSGRRQHPAHAERCADGFGMTAAVNARSDDLLERHDVSADRAKHRGDAIGSRSPIEAPGAMDVVRHDPDRRGCGVTHYVMIVVAMRALVVGLLIAWSSAACSKPPPEPLQLDGNMLTVDNRTSTDWTNVEIWLNTYYRVTVRSIPATSRFQAPLDTFVAGYGQRFDFRRTQVKDLRLTAKLPDGRPLALQKEFQRSGLGALARPKSGGKG